jgi:hypothetical protein
MATTRRTQRWATLALLLLIPIIATSCRFAVGCNLVTVDGRRTPMVAVDSRGCPGEPVVPPMVVPETPLPLLLPLAALGVGSGLLLIRRRRSRAIT